MKAGSGISDIFECCYGLQFNLNLILNLWPQRCYSYVEGKAVIWALRGHSLIQSGLDILIWQTILDTDKPPEKWFDFRE